MEEEMLTKTEREMPENMPEEMQGGPMGRGGFDQAMVAGTVEDTNEWLVPMTATGIISGTIVVAAAAICVMMWWLNKKKN